MVIVPKVDSQELRDLICRLLPGLQICEVASPSGQRIVYFGDLAQSDDPVQRAWGDVVVKVSSGIGPAVITYLQREIRTLNNLNSQSYPKLHFNDVFSQDPENDELLGERLFITIEERIHGEPLSACKQNYSDEISIIDLMIKLAIALRLLWEQKPSLVHRDIKPENILIRPDGSVVVIDLGIAREEGADGVTLTAAIWGPCTPHHSSPEQAKNDKKNITFKSDVFALGILAYELATDDNPFRASDDIPMLDVLNNVVTYNPPKLSDAAEVSDEFSSLVEKMMQKEPYRRPRTPVSLLDSLNRIREIVNAD